MPNTSVPLGESHNYSSYSNDLWHFAVSWKFLGSCFLSPTGPVSTSVLDCFCHASRSTCGSLVGSVIPLVIYKNSPQWQWHKHEKGMNLLWIYEWFTQCHGGHCLCFIYTFMRHLCFCPGFFPSSWTSPEKCLHKTVSNKQVNPDSTCFGWPVPLVFKPVNARPPICRSPQQSASDKRKSVKMPMDKSNISCNSCTV